MSHTPHELHAEFPAHAEKMTHLKETNPRFAKLADEYHKVNRAIHRAETNVEPVDESTEAKMRKERIHLKDQIYALLAN